MNKCVVGMVGALVLTTVAQAETFQMDFVELRDARVTQKKQCASVINGFTVTASTPDGRVTTYKSNNNSHGHGIYISAPSGLPYTTANTTAPQGGTYQLSFEPAITSLTLTLDWLTNQFQPAESLSEFSTDRGAAQVRFNASGNSASFNGQTINATSDRGAGVLNYSGKPFKKFRFKHRQHPRNIGFTIKNIEVKTAPVKCR